jgi:subtilisin family serine protease
MQNLQWGLRAINWFNANRPDARAVRVGVLDTGIDLTHPDLKGLVAADRYFHEGTSARDLLGHGTHVCGIIAAVVNNDTGIAGVARCKLTVWKIFGDQPADDGEFYVEGDAYLRALGAARDAGVRVMNLSIGGTASSRTEQLLFARLESAGVTVAAAMGNEYQEGNPTEYPGAYRGVLAVGAVAESLRRSVFSNTGRHIGLVAPGSNILSTLPMKTSQWLTESEYASWSGTSMATPHVAGAAALLAARNQTWGPAEIKKRLADTARKLPMMKKAKWNATYGAGLLDVARALGANT